jgi:nucleoside-diphosphate-sugar epimerase
MDISIIIPTKNRVNAVNELVDSIVTTSDNFGRIEICFYIDFDDTVSRQGILDLMTKYGTAHIKCATSEEKLNLSQMWNHAYTQSSTGEIIMLCADDIRFRTKSWDTAVKREFSLVDDKILLVFGNDLIQGPNIATHSFVHRKWIETSGFWLPPYFCADYVDTWLDEVARRINRIVYLPNVVTEHMHYSVNKSAYDDNTKQRLENQHRERPDLIFIQKYNERCEHAQKLVDYIESFKRGYIPKNILITGGLGMIGSTLIKQLILNEGYDKHTIVVVDNLWRGSLDNIKGETDSYIDIDTHFYNRDLSLPGQLDDIITKHKIDTVIHLADIVAGIGYVVKNEWFVFNKNILINSNTINSIRTCSDTVKAFVNIGTACSFPKGLQTSLTSVLNETQLYPADPETSYGWSKLMGIYETELLGKETTVQCCNLVFHNVYGAPCDLSERSQVIPALIKKAIQYSSETPFVVWGSGNQARAFLHVDDAVNSIILAMRKGYSHGVIQIGPGTCTSIKDIAEIIIETSGKSIPIHFDTSKPEGDFGRCADFSKATQLLGWTPKMDIKTGISTMYKQIEAVLMK